MLYNKCLIDRTWYKLVRSELYRRWTQCAVKYGNYFWEQQDLNKSWDELVKTIGPNENPAWSIISAKLEANWTNLRTTTEEQITIMEKMKNYGMIIDEQEKGIIDYCVRIARYSFDP